GLGHRGETQSRAQGRTRFPFRLRRPAAGAASCGLSRSRGFPAAERDHSAVAASAWTGIAGVAVLIRSLCGPPVRTRTLSCTRAGEKARAAPSPPLPQPAQKGRVGAAQAGAARAVPDFAPVGLKRIDV